VLQPGHPLPVLGRAKVYADHQIEFEHMAGVNFEG
jgi:hypothetical protein